MTLSQSTSSFQHPQRPVLYRWIDKTRMSFSYLVTDKDIVYPFFSENIFSAKEGVFVLSIYLCSLFFCADDSLVYKTIQTIEIDVGEDFYEERSMEEQT